MIVTDIKKLREISEKVNPDELSEIIEALEAELNLCKDGLGLSAIQIGIPKRVAIIKVPTKAKFIITNATIIDRRHPIKSNESCLSLPGLAILTKRYDTIFFENGDGRIYFANGIDAICIQHEIDHWNGKLITDRKWKKRN